jgi:DNA repair ATPase RecN
MVQDRQNAASDYSAKLSVVKIERTSLDNYGGTSYTYVDLADYKSYIDTYKQKLDSYQSKCYDAISAGKKYQQYLDASSSEYANVQSNEATLSNNIQIYTNNYNNMLSNYNKQKAKQDAYNNYVNKINVLITVTNDLKSYTDTAGLFSSLDQEWLDGLGTKVSAFESACNDAIYAGQTYQQYLDPESTYYKEISDANVKLRQAADEARQSYNDLRSSSSGLSDLIQIFQILSFL